MYINYYEASIPVMGLHTYIVNSVIHIRPPDQLLVHMHSTYAKQNNCSLKQI